MSQTTSPETGLEIARLALTPQPFELDRRGRVPAHHLLSYMEAGRWQLVEENHGGAAALFGHGHYAVVRAQHLVVFEPVKAGVPLHLDTWIHRLGRTSLSCMHLLRPQDGGAALAVGEAVWVHVGPSGPLPLPALQQAQAPPAAAPPHLQIPEAPARAWRLSLPVRPGEVDLLQHMNHASYARYADDGRQLAALDPGDAVPAAQAGWPLARMSVEYLQETRLGQTLTLHSWSPQDAPQTCFTELRVGTQVVARAGMVASTPSTP